MRGTGKRRNRKTATPVSHWSTLSFVVIWKCRCLWFIRWCCVFTAIVTFGSSVSCHLSQLLDKIKWQFILAQMVNKTKRGMHKLSSHWDSCTYPHLSNTPATQSMIRESSRRRCLLTDASSIVSLFSYYYMFINVNFSLLKKEEPRSPTEK